MPNRSPLTASLPSTSIRSLLLMLVAATMLPMALLLVYAGYSIYAQAEDEATSSVLSLARVSADSVETFLDDIRRTMANLAARPQLRRADGAACDPIFAEFHNLYPQIGNFSQASVDGVLICSANPASKGAHADVRDAEWFQRIRQERSFVVDTPHMGLLSGKPVSVLAQPVFDDAGRLVGSIQFTLNLTNFAPAPGSARLPASTVIAIVDRSGLLVARSREAAQFVGRPLPQSQIIPQVLARQSGTTTALSSQGVQRIYGFVPIAGTRWYALAGIATADVFAPARKVALRNLLLALGIVGFAVIVTQWLRRRITRPVQALRDTAQRVAAGDVAARAPSGGPAEVAEVAASLNAMLDADAAQVKALADSEAELRYLVDSSLEAILRIRPGGALLQANPAACELFGRPLPELLQCCRADLFDVADPRMELIQQECSSQGRARGEQTLIRADGSRFEAEVSSTLYTASDGTPRNNIFVRDLSNRIQQEELRAGKEAAELANHAKSVFLARMSHELRTPLNAILGFAQLLQHDAALAATPKAMLMVDHVHNAGRHLLALIDEVLDLSRIEAGALALSPEPIEVGRLITECLALTAALAAQRQIEVQRVGEPEHAECWIRADRTRVRQVFVNVLSNAIKYNRVGGSVLLRLSRSGEHVVLAVQDSGSGLNAAQLAALFQPFNRLGAEASAVEGTGLGLVIVQQLLKAMGGSIEVTSQPAVGSTFTLRLPASEAPAAVGVRANAVAAAQAMGAMALRARRLLYIEDNPANVALVRAVLALRPGLVLEVAGDGPAGVAAALAGAPDLILLDINLPGIDGYEVLRQMRRHPALAPVPCIAVSANAMPGQAERARAAGFADYVVKPFDVKDLLLRIEALIV